VVFAPEPRIQGLASPPPSAYRACPFGNEKQTADSTQVRETMLAQQSTGYSGEHARRAALRQLLSGSVDARPVLTDPASYALWLETQLEAVTAACAATHGLERRVEALSTLCARGEERLLQLARLVKAQSEALDEQEAAHQRVVQEMHRRLCALEGGQRPVMSSSSEGAQQLRGPASPAAAPRSATAGQVGAQLDAWAVAAQLHASRTAAVLSAVPSAAPFPYGWDGAAVPLYAHEPPMDSHSQSPPAELFEAAAREAEARRMRLRKLYAELAAGAGEDDA